jgi:hypothetical protein
MPSAAVPAMNPAIFYFTNFRENKNVIEYLEFG